MQMDISLEGGLYKVRRRYTYRDKCSRKEDECQDGDAMHGNSLVLGLGGNFVHPLCPLLHCFGGRFGGLGIVLAYTHVAVLEDSLELV